MGHKPDREMYLKELTEYHSDLDRYLSWAKSSKLNGLGFLIPVAVTSWILLRGPLNGLQPLSDITKVNFGESADGDRNLIDAINGLHRLFFNSVLSYVEVALIEYCNSNSIAVICNHDRKIDSILADIPTDLTKVRVKIEEMKNGRISTSDILNAALSCLEDRRAKEWRKYFRVLSVIRNKVSHSDVKLSAQEVAEIQSVGFRVSGHVLQLDTGLHVQILHHLTTLLEELEEKRPKLSQLTT